MRKNPEPWGATIESVANDQGGGSSWCSACKATIDLAKIREQNMICPSCGRPLVFGEIGGNFGGSDL